MRLLCISVIILVNATPVKSETDVRLEQSEHGIEALVNDKPFASYLTRSGWQPVVWPMIGPTGAAYTRSYPVGPLQESESEDHVHHRSLWFAHGDVNGFDFWGNTQPDNSCEIVHREFIEPDEDGPAAVVITRNDWMASGEKQCEDVRTVVFGADESAFWIDFTIRLIASEGDVVFGDTKEGTFAVRVAGSMKVDPPGQGQIVNSLGQKNDAAWGQPAEWVDYFGPVDGETVGVAILSHPSNFRDPGRWHVRSYGLFAANPFGESDFPPGDHCQGEVVLPAGDELTLRYMVVLHQGDDKTGDIRRRYQSFAQDADQTAAAP